MYTSRLALSLVVSNTLGICTGKKGSTLNVVFVHFNKLQLLYLIFSNFSLIIDAIEAENFLLKRNGGVNLINTFTHLKKGNFVFCPEYCKY